MSARAARVKLNEAVERMAGWKGRAEWINGYRVGKHKHDPAESDRMLKAEGDAYGKLGDAKVELKRALAAYTRALRREASRP